jgi:hypothetical protein
VGDDNIEAYISKIMSYQEASDDDELIKDIQGMYATTDEDDPIKAWLATIEESDRSVTALYTRVTYLSQDILRSIRIFKLDKLKKITTTTISIHADKTIMKTKRRHRVLMNQLKNSFTKITSENRPFLHSWYTEMRDMRDTDPRFYSFRRELRNCILIRDNRRRNAEIHDLTTRYKTMNRQQILDREHLRFSYHKRRDYEFIKAQRITHRTSTNKAIDKAHRSKNEYDRYDGENVCNLNGGLVTIPQATFFVGDIFRRTATFSVGDIFRRRRHFSSQHWHS